MREKRPRISDSRGFKERLQHTVSDNTSMEFEINTYSSQSSEDLPETEARIEELRHPGSFEPIIITDYPLVHDQEPDDHLNDEEVNTEILSDIYNSFTLDDSL